MGTISRAATVAVLVTGCAMSDGSEGVRRIDVTTPPASSGVLRVESDLPLEFGTMVAVDSQTVLALDGATGDVWLLDLSRSEVELRPLVRSDGRLGGRLVAVAHGPESLRLVDRTGAIHTFAVGDWSLVETTPPVAAGAVLSAAGNGSGLALLKRVRTATGMGVALFVVDSAGATHRAWESPSVAGDFPHVTAVSDGWLVSAADPPRIIHLDTRGDPIAEILLEGVPRRAVSEEVVAEFERLAAEMGVAGSAAPPRYYPGVTAVHSWQGGLLAVPHVESGLREAQGLDWYCDSRYAGTLFDSPDIVQVLLLPNGAILVREQPPGRRIDYYRYADLPLGCPLP